MNKRLGGKSIRFHWVAEDVGDLKDGRVNNN